MKIGILTYQFADNYGAVLQCYALRHVINSLPDCNAEIINYVPKDFAYGKTWSNEYEYCLFQKKRESFEKFLQEKCGLNKPLISSVKDDDEYDCYVVGSDQIWNTIWEEYFLPEIVDRKRCVSYAASIGLGIDSPRLNKEMLRRYIPKFECVSLREYAHVDLINELCGRKCECVLDPVLLLDGRDYEYLMENETLRKGKFLFFFWIPHDTEYVRGVEFVNNLSRATGLSIVHSLAFATDYMFQKDGGNMQFEEIGNFLWYIRHAEYVVTNSYHATLFSMLFQTPFYTFVTDSMRARIDTLCERFDIGERVIERYLPMERVTEKVDFDAIHEKIKMQRDESMKYLKYALDIT